MKLKLNLDTTELAPEGIHAATVKNITSKEESKKVVIEFGINVDGKDYVASKAYPAKLDEKSPLLADVQVLLGRKFDAKSSGEEIDLSEVVGKTCSVVVVHRKGQGRKTVASVLTVSALSPATPAPAAA